MWIKIKFVYTYLHWLTDAQHTSVRPKKRTKDRRRCSFQNFVNSITFFEIFTITIDLINTMVMKMHSTPNMVIDH